MPRIKYNDNMDVVFEKMSEGNIKAKSILHKIWQYDKYSAMQTIDGLDALGFYGYQIVKSYQFSKTIPDLILNVKNKNVEMINFVYSGVSTG